MTKAGGTSNSGAQPRARPAAASTAGASPPPNNTVARAREKARAAPQPLVAGAPVPPELEARFLRIGDSYYFPDRTLAFVDHGRKLVARTNNAEVARTLVEIARTRGWGAVAVNGAAEFRRAVWLAAMSVGLQVHGYEASSLDLAESQRRLADQRGGPGDARLGPQTVQAPNGTTRLSGRLLGHGPAHYKFEPKRRQSYFLKVRTANGERTLWGADLERALVESEGGVSVGDLVSVEGAGADRVKVKVPVRDDTGALVGERVIETRRNRWLIETPAWFTQRDAAAAALRDGRPLDQETQTRHGAVASAATALWLVRQWAKRHIERSDDRTRIETALQQRLADMLARGDAIPMPMVRTAARTQLRSGDAPPAAQRSRNRARAEPEIPPHVHG